MLRVIERATRQPIEPMQLPTIADVNEQRVARFNARIAEALSADDIELFRGLVGRYEQEHNVPALDIAAALASIAQGKKPLLLDESSDRHSERPAPRERVAPREREVRERAPRERESRERSFREPERSSAPAHKERAQKGYAQNDHPQKERRERVSGEGFSASQEKLRLAKRAGPQETEEGMETFRVEVGHVHGIKPGNIVGAIANEAGLDGKHIGRVVIRDDHSFVDLPEDMPKDVFRNLQKARVGGQKLQISRALKTDVERLSRDKPPPQKERFAKKRPKSR